MKKSILKITIISVLLLVYSCESKTKVKQKDTVKVEESVTHESTSNEVVLDNGNLWVANSETTTGINNMIGIMNSFSNRNKVEAYGKLKESLNNEFTMIFQNCTMTGESHNQLHNFLVPIKDLFETLDSSDIKVCQDSFSKLKLHLEGYDSFFK